MKTDTFTVPNFVLTLPDEALGLHLRTLDWGFSRQGWEGEVPTTLAADNAAAVLQLLQADVWRLSDDGKISVVEWWSYASESEWGFIA